MDAIFRLLLLLCSITAACGLFTTSAAASSRVALIIGNGAYDSTTPLPNASNDGRAVAAALRELDFEVLEGIDLNRGQMQSLIAQFSRSLRDAEVGLFFYAGHGMQVEGENYLLPVNAVLKDDADLPFQTIPVDIVLRQMERAVPTRLVFLDACRDNPLAKTLVSSQGASRSMAVGQGLAQMQAGVGTLIAYATEPNSVALDGNTDHSPFTAAFLEHVNTPGIEVRQLLTRVRQDVLTATNNSQVPWDHSSLTGEFFFLPPEPTVATTLPAPVAANPAPVHNQVDKSIEIAFWQTAQQLTIPTQKKAALEAYIQQFPEGEFLPLAKLMLATLPPPEQQVIRSSETPETPAPATTSTEVNQPVSATQTTAMVTPPVEPLSTKPPEPLLSPEEQAEQAEEALQLNANQRQRIQRGLTAIGFNTQGVDGIFGPNSRAAIRAYQGSRDLPVTGYLDKAQWEKLVGESRQALVDLERQAKARQAAAQAQAQADAQAKAQQAKAQADAQAKAQQAKAAAEEQRRQQAAQTAAPPKAVNWGFKRCMNNYEKTYSGCVAEHGEP